ncbi:MAG: MTH938/NDUFAF3 family protein [Hyphomicrobium sp.]|jgi:uncharacterized protein
MTAGLACFPRIAPIDAYGNGGFRFAGMSHKGSLLCLPSGIFEWAGVGSIGDVSLQKLQKVLDDRQRVGLLLLGTGPELKRPSLDVRQAFVAASVGLEIMDTGAACRTFNVLLAEGRAIAAALIAVA